MKTSQRQISQSGGERSTSSRADSPASLFPTRGSGEEEMTSVTSGRRCCGLLTKSGPLGSLVRTLLESPLWSKEGYSLRWEATPLCSERVTDFTDTSCGNPSPSSASAETLRVLDIPSSRCLFRLRLSELPTEGTGSSSLPTTRLLPTTQAMDYTDVRGKMGKNDKLVDTPSGLRRVIQTGSDFGVSLGFMANNGLLPTPRANKVTDLNLTAGVAARNKANLEEEVAKMLLDGLLPTPTFQDWKKRGPNSKQQGIGEVVRKMLPTPRAGDERNPSSPDGKRIARKKEQGWTIQLNDLEGMGMLPTPSARDFQPPYNPEAMIRKNGMVRDDQLSSLPTMLGLKERGGITFRLSPLFTQEMMGFPYLWTELPFLLTSGEQNPSKPTETP